LVKKYVPERGDIVWLHFDPQAGHEQKGTRPALTVSPALYNRKSGLALFCPITSQVKGYPFEVAVAGKNIRGVVLSDQIKSLDWKVRKASRIERAAPAVLEEALAKIATLVTVT
jgi:mRNA interferase MazF